MTRILVVEDNEAILRGVRDNLLWEDYEVAVARTGGEALRIIREEELDLVILDVMLPGMNGFEVCRRLRRDGSGVPVLMLTARGEEVDRLMGFDLGADDYVTKPFSVPELLARIRAILRRTRPEQELPDRVAFDDVEVDFVAYEATRGDETLQLSPKEFGTLRLLVARAGEVVSRGELLKEVWGLHRIPTTRTVDNHIASLRAKLEREPSAPRRLLTVHGVGYKFVPDDRISPAS
ncbi:MAG: response regulator transcription factor [Gemmatimonadota bacterium]|jgi:two-component system response regulator VicR